MKECKICGCTSRTSRKIIRKNGCISCIDRLNRSIETTKKYKKENSEKISSGLKAWRNKNKEYVVSYRIKYREINTLKLREAKKNYRLNNKEKINALNAKRRASKIKRIPSWFTESDKLQIEALYSSSIRISKCLEVQHHIDHIIPLNGKLVSGLHIPSNLQIIPEFYNLSKHNSFIG